MSSFRYRGYDCRDNLQYNGDGFAVYVAGPIHHNASIIHSPCWLDPAVLMMA